MGSQSDFNIMKKAADIIKEFGVSYNIQIISAHRTPDKMFEFAKTAHEKKIKIIIAGAGGAAHLPGMVASLSPLPVIGVPIKSSNSIQGIDSLLSIVQMPNGVPVATVAIDAGLNAGLLSIQILSINNSALQKKIIRYKENLAKKVLEQNV
jgi:5-(carboxyamino)imidazole ribonucleotide mutase